MISSPNVSYSFTARLELTNKIDIFSQVAQAIAAAEGDLDAIDLVRSTPQKVIRDITVNAIYEQHAAEIVQAIEQLEGIRIVLVSDRTFLLHLGGKIEVCGSAHDQGQHCCDCDRRRPTECNAMRQYTDDHDADSYCYLNHPTIKFNSLSEKKPPCSENGSLTRVIRAMERSSRGARDQCFLLPMPHQPGPSPQNHRVRS